MRNTQEKYILSAVAKLPKEDTFERIKADISERGNERKMIMSINKEKKTRGKKVVSRIALALAACFILAIGLFGGNYYAENIKVDSIVNLDINPSIELSANRKDKVLEVTPLNPDGKKIIGDMDLENVSLDIAVNAIIGSMIQNGYSGENLGEILVTVKNENESRAQLLQTKITENIKSTLNNNDEKVTVIEQIITDSKETQEFAKTNGISEGKAEFILHICEKDSSLKAEDLAKLSIHEIAVIVNQKGIDISGFAEYERDETTAENIEEIIEEIDEKDEDDDDKPVKVESKPSTTTSSKIESKPSTTTSSKAQTTSEYISKSKAQSVALKAAGVSEASAQKLKAVLDYDDGRAHYDVGFYADDYEYDYEIDAISGKIIDFDRERMEADDYDDLVVNTESKVISKSEAEAIAKKHAGVSGVKVVKCELDEDDGVKVYEIELKTSEREYDYEINAVSGDIIDYDSEKIDYDDDDDDD